MPKPIQGSLESGFVQMASLPPAGDRCGRTYLKLAVSKHTIRVIGPYAEGASAGIDWYNQKMQILVHDGVSDDPALHVRFNKDGRIAEILIRDELCVFVRTESQVSRKGSHWQTERDGE